MQVISKAADRVSKLWGKQRLKDTGYRRMRYTLCTDVEEGRLIHNAMTGELLLLNAEETAALDALPGTPSQILIPLVEKHFLVPVAYDEHKAMQQLRAMLQTMNVTKEITGYTILPTTHCNARCFYCYESELEHVHMSEETAHALVEFIEAHHGDKDISIGWFGGEPLVGWKRIDQICRELTEKGITFRSSMISNGYLFDAEMVRRAKENWKVKNIQITLDGTEEVYNRVKAYTVAGGSPYQKVLKSIELLLDAEIVVSIRMNMDKHNHEDLKALIDELAERFDGRKGFSANVAVLFDDCGFDPVHHTGDDKSQLEQWQQELRDRLKDAKLAGIDRGLPSLRYRFCMADNDGSVIVNPQGEFDKCEHYIDTSRVGSISEGIVNAEEMARWKVSLEMPQCSDCELLPHCYKIECCVGQNHCTDTERHGEHERVIQAMYTRYEHWQKELMAEEDEEGIEDIQDRHC